MTEETNPDVTDAGELDDFFADDTVTVDETKDSQAGTEDVLGKGEVENLSLEELKAVSGREFKSKEEYLKHYENLKKLVGDQDLAKKRKDEKKDTTTDKVGELEKKIAEMERAGITKDFLLEVPTAKEHLDLVEAYAEKQGISLSEAWNTKFANLVESSQKNVINKNRINPIQSQQITQLAEKARGGDESAQDALIQSVMGMK